MPVNSPVDCPQATCLVGRRPNPRVVWSSQSTAQSTGPKGNGLCTFLCTSVDRAPVRSTGRLTASSPNQGFRRLKLGLVKPIKILFKSHKFQKNRFIEMLWSTNMCDQKSTHITNYLNHFCEVKYLALNKNRIFQKPNFEMEIQFFPNLYKYKNKIIKLFWSIEYMDRIQYTCKMKYLCFWQ